MTTALMVLLLAAAVLGLAGARLMLRHRHRMRAERPVSLVKAGSVACHRGSGTSRVVGIGAPRAQTPHLRAPHIQVEN